VRLGGKRPKDEVLWDARRELLMTLLEKPPIPARCARPIATRCCVLAALAALAAPSGAALAQAPSRTTAVDELVETIERIESESDDGALAAELIDPLEELALRYAENDDYALAAATIERALDVVRVNYGLYSLEQAPLLQQYVANEKARGDPGSAWELEQELITLLHRHPDDLATVPMFRGIADQRMDLIERYIAGEFPPEILLGCYYRSAKAAFGSCSAGSKGIAVRHILQEAKEYYESAIGALLHHELYASDELRDLEMKLIRANYFHGSELIPPSRYVEGKARLNRLIDYDAETSETFGQIDALVQIADWDLMYSNNSKALETYEDAYAQLLDHDIAQESIDRLFAPETPVVLPVFVPNPLVSEEMPDSRGYVDVAFEITRFGRARQIRVLDTTTNATRADLSMVEQLIMHARFRPRTEDGHFSDASLVDLRYYLSE